MVRSQNQALGIIRRETGCPQQPIQTYWRAACRQSPATTEANVLPFLYSLFSSWWCFCTGRFISHTSLLWLTKYQNKLSHTGNTKLARHCQSPSPPSELKCGSAFSPLSFAAVFLFVGVSPLQKPVLSQLSVATINSSTPDCDCTSNAPLTETSYYHPFPPSSKSLADRCTQMGVLRGVTHF